MRIYTEVNFQWDDKKGKLVEVSSDSFDYSGEMALCKWETWEELGVDDAGVAYRVRGNDKNNQYEDWQVQRRTKGGDWEEHHYSAYNYNQRSGMINAAFGTIENTMSAEGGSYGKGLHSSLDIWEGWYEEETNYVPSGDTVSNQANVTAAQDPLNTWVAPTDDNVGSWENIETLKADTDNWQVDDAGEWTRVVPEDDGLDGVDPGIDYTKVSKDEARKTAELAIADKIKEWQKLTTAGDDDSIELLVKGYVSTLKEKETAVQTAYEDIWGEGGSIFDIEETYEIAEEGRKTKYTTELGLAGTAKEEGLEETVVGREGELEALREEAGGEIRAAEAKIGAAGFASTGVGRTARDVLAEEIGGAARDIDEGFTEERSDVKRTYLEKTDPLKKEFGAGGTAYEDYIRTRDIAAKGTLKAWETASTAYETAKTQYEDIYMPGAELDYMAALGDIGTDIMGFISDVRTGTFTDEEDIEFDPFAPGAMLGRYTAEQFGLDTDLMFTEVPTTGDFAAPTDFYTPYQAGEDLKLYDPEALMPWEEPIEKDQPGGQR
tara:strand:+ start:19 stop:1662 length:1644 start_codon:yes stop_codon:yes gene_type:complete